MKRSKRPTRGDRRADAEQKHEALFKKFARHVAEIAETGEQLGKSSTDHVLVLVDSLDPLWRLLAEKFLPGQADAGMRAVCGLVDAERMIDFIEEDGIGAANLAPSLRRAPRPGWWHLLIFTAGRVSLMSFFTALLPEPPASGGVS